MGSEAVKNISPEDAQKLLQGAEPVPTYLDVRTPEEFAQGHVAGAVNIPVMLSQPAGMTPNVQFVTQVESQFPRSAPLLVGCKSGARSSMAATQLVQAGFQEVSNVSGGIMAWTSKGLPLST